MAKIPEGVDPRQLTVVARRVLLDGIDALSDHLPALTIVGAQAVYLRTPDAAISNAPSPLTVISASTPFCWASNRTWTPPYGEPAST
ncbi:hypothetical protein SANT12839_059420 [Streptomyces antimycoticus]|uniref:Uncharacterized protein n=1 Tax=Streptomyces antimycoticus TaxID=68175 RepID=A0A4D4KE24_9ACTN|nr:hypothetical protein [Streptomyces antimycoticus]GDY45060.1 hypothetical protein SANT12839_059420 [Streptomyces antimycoticus]